MVNSVDKGVVDAAALGEYGGEGGEVWVDRLWPHYVHCQGHDCVGGPREQECTDADDESLGQLQLTVQL